MHPITEYFSSNSSDPCNIASCTMKALDWRVSAVQFSEPFPPQSFIPPSPGVSTLACTFGFLLFVCRAIPQWPIWCGTKFMLWGMEIHVKEKIPKSLKLHTTVDTFIFWHQASSSTPHSVSCTWMHVLSHMKSRVLPFLSLKWGKMEKRTLIPRLSIILAQYVCG